MNTREFSDGFDILVSSYMRFEDFDDREILDSIEFNEHEKSVFLTKSQEEIVIGLYNGRNPLTESFEETEELRRYLAPITREAELKPIETTNGRPLGVDSKSKFFTLPEDLWFITYESVLIGDGECEGHTTLDVYPVTQDEYHKTKRNPFRGANFRRALRLDLSDGNIEIVAKYNVIEYYLRYVKRPNPIILEDLPNQLTINGINSETQCELHDALHQRILENAVQMALRSKVGGTSGRKKEENN